MLIKSARLWLFSSTGRVWLRPSGSAGPKSRKSHSLASLIHHSRNLKITKFHMGRRTPAGSVSALRAPQGQSRKKMITSPLLIKNSQNKQISYGNGEHRPGLSLAFAGPKLRKSDHQTYFNLKLVKINKFHNGKKDYMWCLKNRTGVY